MKIFDMVPKKAVVLTPKEYVKLFQESPDSIASVRMVLPRIGKDNHFGNFEVFFASDYDYYEVEDV